MACKHIPRVFYPTSGTPIISIRTFTSAPPISAKHSWHNRPSPTVTRRTAPIPESQAHNAIIVAQTITRSRAYAVTKAEIPDLRKFVAAAEKCGFGEVRGKVLRDVVEKFVAGWPEGERGWGWLVTWAKDNNYSARTLHNAAITLLTSASTTVTTSSQTIALTLLYAAYLVSPTPSHLITLAHLSLFHRQELSASNIFQEARKPWRNLVALGDPDAQTVEARGLLWQGDGQEETARRLLVQAIGKKEFHFRPVALTMLGRLCEDAGDGRQAGRLFKEAVDKYDYSVAHDEIATAAKVEIKEDSWWRRGLLGDVWGLREMMAMFSEWTLTDKPGADRLMYDESARQLRKIVKGL